MAVLSRKNKRGKRKKTGYYGDNPLKKGHFIYYGGEVQAYVLALK